MDNKKINKILFVVPKYSSFYKMITRTFRELNLEYQTFDNRKTTIIEKIFFISSKILHFKFNSHESINKRLLQKVSKYKPDLVFIIKGENLLPKTVLKIKEQTLIINWFPDSLRYFKKQPEWIKSFSAFFQGDNYEIQHFKKLGYQHFYYLPWASPKLALLNKKRKYDIVFIGVYNKKREEIFRSLDRLNFYIWGSKSWRKSSLGKHYMGKWISSDKALEVMKQAKIVVNFHQNKPKSTMLNLRVYEATACGALLISDYWPDLPSLFKIDREVISYKSKSELVSKISYYLEHSSERETIAKEGYKRTMKDHTYINRVEKMLEILSKNF